MNPFNNSVLPKTDTFNKFNGYDCYIGIDEIDGNEDIEDIEDIDDELSLELNLIVEDMQQIIDSVDDDEEVDLKILKERSQSITEITENIEHTNFIMKKLSSLIFSQGENINIVNKSIEKAEDDTNKACHELSEAENLTSSTLKTARDVAILIGGLSLGALGFIGGSVMGIGTLIVGGVISGGVITVSHKIDK